MHETTSATATFLFTDIEGSTQLLRAHRADYATILAEHHRLLRDAVAAHGGREIDNQGDSFFVAFSRARDAVLAAAAAQRAIAAHKWPGGASVRVRMGIHTGEAERAADRYLGLSVHRAARISAVGHGGQILVSQTTAGLLEDDDVAGLSLRELGEHQLKDISRPVRLYQLEGAGLRTAFPPLKRGDVPRPSRRRRAALVASPLVLLLVAAAVALALARGGSPPPEVLPDSLVRLDPDSLQPRDVVPISAGADLTLSAGGFLWTTHYVLRDVESGALRDAGDRTLTRVDPSTGDVVTVGGGLAPCGLAPDPSGDVWVANCFPAASGGGTNVVRVDATSLEFEATWRVPGGNGFYRGLAYGGGSLWVGELGDFAPGRHVVTQVDPQTGRQRALRIERDVGPLAWAEGYGDLWLSNFDSGSVTRLSPAEVTSDVFAGRMTNPGSLVVAGDSVWVADWGAASVVRLPAVGTARARTIRLPTKSAFPDYVGVWLVAAGGGYVWATTPRDGAVWRIETRTNRATRIDLPHLPTGVTATEDGIWVAVRGA